jgi:hypothetical protein
MKCQPITPFLLRIGSLAVLLLITLAACQASTIPTTLPTALATNETPNTISPTVPPATVVINERQILIALYEATEGEGWLH